MGVSPFTATESAPTVTPTTTTPGSTPVPSLEELQQQNRDLQAENTRLLNTVLGLEPTVPKAPVATASSSPPPAPSAPQALKPEEVTLIQGARLICASAHPDFTQFVQEIDGIMANMPISERKSSAVWETVYFNVKGRHTDELVSRARTTPVPGPPSGERPTIPAVPAAGPDKTMSALEEEMFSKLSDARGSNERGQRVLTREKWIERRNQMNEGGQPWILHMT